MEEVGEFTVNVPPRELAAEVNLWGTVSGRDHDKFQEARLTPVASRQVRPPIIQECVVHYECRILHKNDVVPALWSRRSWMTPMPKETSTGCTSARSWRPTRSRRRPPPERSGGGGVPHGTTVAGNADQPGMRRTNSCNRITVLSVS